MLDISTYRRRIGLFLHRGAKKIHSCKTPKKQHMTKTESTIKPITTKWKLMLMLFIALCILNGSIWTPQDTRSGKNRQRNGKFTPFNYKSIQEKEQFNIIRKLETNLTRTESHLQFFRSGPNLDQKSVRLSDSALFYEK